jgi:hypothetical protein
MYVRAFLLLWLVLHVHCMDSVCAATPLLAYDGLNHSGCQEAGCRPSRCSCAISRPVQQESSRLALDRLFVWLCFGLQADCWQGSQRDYLLSFLLLSCTAQIMLQLQALVYSVLHASQSFAKLKQICFSLYGRKSPLAVHSNGSLQHLITDNSSHAGRLWRPQAGIQHVRMHVHVGGWATLNARRF